jgi:hypothetical protein
LPDLAEQKLTKTGYTRGASVREIYQNRVTRNNPVLIPWEWWDACRTPDDGTEAYENGFIVLVEPEWLFTVDDAVQQLAKAGVVIGENALVVYRRRADWTKFGPEQNLALPNGMAFEVAKSRAKPLGGTYFARVAGTVARDVGGVVVSGFDSTAMRGAGIRVFEYASMATILAAKTQLEALLWMCDDAEKAMQDAGMSALDVDLRSKHIIKAAGEAGLVDEDRLRTLRMIDVDGHTVCPLCLQRIKAADFLERTKQAEGREVHDLTTTEVSLFHIQELRIGKLQHRPYNLAWGHHFCNVVVKDAGIIPTLKWMQGVLDNQPTSDLEAVEASVEEAVDP